MGMGRGWGGEGCPQISQMAQMAQMAQMGEREAAAGTGDRPVGGPAMGTERGGGIRRFRRGRR